MEGQSSSQVVQASSVSEIGRDRSKREREKGCKHVWLSALKRVVRAVKFHTDTEMRILMCYYDYDYDK